jgi:eukaryotic-like serine/threonine-protein kinase
LKNDPTQEGDPTMTMTIERPATAWGFGEGDEIAPGLTALRLLGGGTRYEAYLAFDERLHHVTVVKVLRPERVADESAVRGLRDEAEVLGSLNHPAIARLLRSAIDGPRPHIVLEFVEGPRLSTLIRRFGPLETEQAAALAVEIASALHYLHGLDVVHLDVKPKNLIMGAPPRLIDLSIARSFTDAASLTVPVGTDVYMAPEQCRPQQGSVGPAADVWGLGVTLYESLVGEPAFPRGSRQDGATAEERFPQLTHRPAPMPSRMPSELVGVVDAALAFEPEDRPTAREVADAVEPLLRRPRRLVLNMLKPR